MFEKLVFILSPPTRVLAFVQRHIPTVLETAVLEVVHGQGGQPICTVVQSSRNCTSLHGLLVVAYDRPSKA